MTAKKIQPTNPTAAPSEAKNTKDAGDKPSTRKTASAMVKHRTSGRKANRFSGN